MLDRVVENTEIEAPEIPELLERVLLFVLEEAKGKIDQGQDLIPFTALVVKENIFFENHPGNSADECFDAAAHTVEGARGAGAYAFCYDGFIETDNGTKDALIAEGGVPGEEDGIAIGYLYTTENGAYVFQEEPVYIGEAPNFMADLKESDEYAVEEIDERYLSEDDEEAEEDDEEGLE